MAVAPYLLVQVPLEMSGDPDVLWQVRPRVVDPELLDGSTMLSKTEETPISRA